MRVLFITNYPSPYRVDFFNEFGARNGFDLTVIFLEKPSEQKHRSAKWFHEDYSCFTAVFPQKRINLHENQYLCPEIIGILNKGFDVVIFCGIDSPSAIISIEYLKIKRIPYWIEGDGAFAKDGKGFKEKLKKNLISGAEGCFSTGIEHDNYYLKYGANRSSIYRYPFTSLKDKDILSSPLNMAIKHKLRKELGLRHDNIVLTVGQFIYRKGFDVLLSCALQLHEYNFYFVGGKPRAEHISFITDNSIDNVFFIPFQNSEELKQFYRAADVFVLPTREDIWGLVINEAMANGLPVITTDRCIAGLELVHNGENGFIVPTEDVEGIVDSLKTIYSLDTEKMSIRSLEIIKNYTIEKMVDAHVEILSR